MRCLFGSLHAALRCVARDANRTHQPRNQPPSAGGASGMREHRLMKNIMGSLVAKRPPCSVCGLDTLRRDDWFLVVENRWLDRLKILTWHPSLAAHQGFKSACGREHLRILIGFWLDKASLGLPPQANEVMPITSNAGPDEAELGPGASGRLVGELSVFREAFSSEWTGSPATLEAIVDALIPVEYRAQSLATEFPLLQPSHEPRGLPLH